MTRIAGDWLGTAETQAVFDLLERAGFQAWFVGGCVRDALAGRPVKDIDIATDARPETVIDLAGNGGLKAVPTGVEHGTVTLVSGETAHEVTTLRRDVETDGRRAVVAYATEIAEDAARRDFTMNALYADRHGEVIDPTGFGVADLAAGRVRFVGDPETRIREDYLRIPRYFRFLARFGTDGPDTEALAAIGANLAGIDTLSAERIGHEMRRVLELEDPAPSLATMAQIGVLAHLIPGADTTALAPLVHLEGLMVASADPLRRLAVLGGEDVAVRLRLSRAEARALSEIREAALSDRGASELGYRFGADRARDALLVRSALMGQPLPPGVEDDLARGAAAEFPVRATDLMDRFEGPALGAALAEREARWIVSDFVLTREDLLQD